MPCCCFMSEGVCGVCSRNFVTLGADFEGHNWKHDLARSCFILERSGVKRCTRPEPCFVYVVETLFQNRASLENDDLHNDSISEEALPWHCLSLFWPGWPTILNLKVLTTGPKSQRVSKSALLQNQGNILAILEQKHRSSKEEILRFLTEPELPGQ